MKTRGTVIRVVSVMLLALAGALSLQAQSRLYVLEPDGDYHPVLKMENIRPYIMSGDKLIAASGHLYALSKAPEYLPVYVDVKEMDAGTTGLSSNEVGTFINTTLNSQFHFQATFLSAYTLEDAFIVLEVLFEDGTKNIFPYEVGRLEAQVPHPFVVDVPLGKANSRFKYLLHLFTGGMETFTPEQPAAVREEQIKLMIGRRIAGVKESGPKRLMGPPPAYPAVMRSSGVTGRAVIAFHISTEGKVLNPMVEQATAPAFGDAALAAVSQWRFVPAVENGKPVETPVSLPITFTPPPPETH